MKEQPVWFCACVLVGVVDLTKRIADSQVLYGRKRTSMATARDDAFRIWKSMNACRMDGMWTVGIGRSFNRDARPSFVSWSKPGECHIPDHPPVKA